MTALSINKSEKSSAWIKALIAILISTLQHQDPGASALVERESNNLLLLAQRGPKELYLTYRLRQVGQERDCFQPAAVDLLVIASKDLPISFNYWLELAWIASRSNTQDSPVRNRCSGPSTPQAAADQIQPLTPKLLFVRSSPFWIRFSSLTSRSPNRLAKFRSFTTVFTKRCLPY